MFDTGAGRRRLASAPGFNGWQAGGHDGRGFPGRRTRAPTPGPASAMDPARLPGSDPVVGAAGRQLRRSVGPPAAGTGVSAETLHRVERAGGQLATRVRGADGRAAALVPLAAGRAAVLGHARRAGRHLRVRGLGRRPGTEYRITGEVFGTAPRDLVRAVSLRRTVELVRIAITVAEEDLPALAVDEAETDRAARFAAALQPGGRLRGGRRYTRPPRRPAAPGTPGSRRRSSTASSAARTSAPCPPGRRR